MAKSISQLQWHPEVHRKWAHEQLVFWRLGFYPTYRRNDVIQALDLVCERHGIRGRVMYEVFGQHDVLARFWLPAGVSKADVDRDIKRTLAAFHLEMCDDFTVDKVRKHWFWDESHGSGSLPTPLDEDALADPPSERVLLDTSDVVDQFNEGALTRAELEAHVHAGDFIAKGILGLRDILDGIKFAMIVSAPAEISSRYIVIDALAAQLERVLDTPGPIIERSLYSGVGFARFLILGKVPPEHFFEITESLIEPIVNEASLSGAFRTRSVTYIANNPKLLSFSEALAVSPPAADSTVVEMREILAGGENARVEFKASAFVNVNQWLYEGKRAEDADVTMTFARAVVALLNSNGGGTVVSGVLEASVRDYESQLADEPRVHDLIVLGIEFDWRDWRRPGWDQFENRLRQKLETLIEPNPLAYLSIDDHALEGRTLCSVVVTPGAPRWFYVKNGDAFDFVIRHGASSKVISGPQEDEYKNLHPR